MLIAIPLLLIPVVLYNIVVLFGGSGDAGVAQADVLLRDPLFAVTTGIAPGTRERLTRPDDVRQFGAMAAAPLFEGMDL